MYNVSLSKISQDSRPTELHISLASLLQYMSEIHIYPKIYKHKQLKKNKKNSPAKRNAIGLSCSSPCFLWYHRLKLSPKSSKSSKSPTSASRSSRGRSAWPRPASVPGVRSAAGRARSAQGRAASLQPGQCRRADGCWRRHGGSLPGGGDQWLRGKKNWDLSIPCLRMKSLSFLHLPKNFTVHLAAHYKWLIVHQNCV